MCTAGTAGGNCGSRPSLCLVGSSSPWHIIVNIGNIVHIVDIVNIVNIGNIVVNRVRLAS